MRYYGITLAVCLSFFVCQSVFSFLGSNLSKYQWIFTRLGVFIDIVEIWFGIVNGQISSIFDSYLPVTGPYFHLWMITLVIVNGFSLNGVCIDIMQICFRIADGQISSIFDSYQYLPATCPYFHFLTITLVINYQWIFTKLSTCL